MARTCDGGKNVSLDTESGYETVMGRLLTLDEIAGGKSQGYAWSRWIHAEASASRDGLRGCLRRQAVGSATIELYIKEGGGQAPNVALIYMEGLRAQALSYEDWDGSGVEAATRLFEDLVTGGDLDVTEV